MYSIFSGKRKTNLQPEEFEPPLKKVSDKDVLIKQLSKKQLSTKTSLHKELSVQQQFQSRTEISPLYLKPGTNTLKIVKENTNQSIVIPDTESTQSVELNSFQKIELEFNRRLSATLLPKEIKKIRRKARALSNKIKSLDIPLNEPKTNLKPINDNSKWDKKESEIISIKEKKEYTCKPQNLYTIKDGKIVKLNDIHKQDLIEIESSGKPKKISLDEILAIPKFANYKSGDPSDILYLKNLPNNLKQEDLQEVLNIFNVTAVNIRLMEGKMKGQAFLTFKDLENASEALKHLNGILLKNKPLIVQYGKGKT